MLGGGKTVGRFVLIPDVTSVRGIPLEARIVAIALADQFGARVATRDTSA